MRLDRSKLVNVRQRPGKIIARCPACAERGGDSKGEHLAIFPDGRFACVANPGEGGHEHRQRIFALVGINEGGVPLEKLFRVRRPKRGGGILAINGTVGTGIFNSRATGNSDIKEPSSPPALDAHTEKTFENPSPASQTTSPTPPPHPLRQADKEFWVYLAQHSRVVDIPLPRTGVQLLLNLGAPIMIQPIGSSSGWQAPCVYGFKSNDSGAERGCA